MAIQREDLVAAASLGLLQYRQIDPLLIFLLQRDVRYRREVMLAQTQPARGPRTYVMLSYLAGMLAIATAALFAVLFTSRAVESLGMGALFFLTVLYALCAIGVVSWFKRWGFGMLTRILSGFLVALVPVAVFGLQQVIR